MTDPFSCQGFFAEMVKGVSDGGNILLVYFASKDEGVEEKYQKDSARLQSFAKDRTIHPVKATEENFIEEVKKAEVIYLRGGDTQKLKAALDTFPDFTETIRGKTISGSSAGAYILSTHYFTNSQNKVLEGYGCIPVKVVCHYESMIHPAPEGVDQITEMEKYDQGLELVLLRDYEWKIFNV